MSCRTLVVHPGTSLRAHPRLALAITLARQFVAHPTGVFALYTPNPGSLDVMSGTDGYFEAHMPLRAAALDEPTTRRPDELERRTGRTGTNRANRGKCAERCRRAAFMSRRSAVGADLFAE